MDLPPTPAESPETIAVLHERYREAGGEDVVFEAETALLEQHGHRVERITLANQDIPARPNLRQVLELGAGTIWSPRQARMVFDRVKASGATILHVHNPFPLFSPSVFAAGHRAGAATVFTLHNFRLICPAATLFRDGRPCEDCVGRRVPLPGVIHACYRGSRLQSATVAAMIAGNRIRRTWDRDVDVFIALTNFARDKLIDGGFPRSRLAVKPNFVGQDPGPRQGAGDGFVYAGRLSPEKGVEVLIAAMAHVGPEVSVRVAGEGPLAPIVAAAAASGAGIRPLGFLKRTELADEMTNARALVFPSQCYEGMGMAVIEAFAAGLPVIASRLGGIPDLVHDGETGILVDSADAHALARALTWATQHPAEMAAMGRQARREYETKFTAEASYASLIDVYRRARRAHLSVPGRVGPAGLTG